MRAPEVFAPSYLVSCLPLEHEDYVHFALVVKFRRNWDMRWVVTDGVQLFDVAGNKAYPSVLSREKLIESYSFADLGPALEVARLFAPHVRINGKSVDDVLGGES
jgi:hypothetical protein